MQVTKGRSDSVVPARPVVSSVATEGGRPPPPAGDSLSADGRVDRVALIRSLRTLDRTAFLRQVLGAWYSARVVSTLLAAFRPSSQRQHDLAWRTFQAWLPVATCHMSHSVVVEFLQHLFDDRGLSPCTLLCYRAALKWSLQEAFQVNFEHADFRRQVTGLFHLRPPPSSPLPQWDLTAVLRFYEAVDVSTAPIRMVFFLRRCSLQHWRRVISALSWLISLVEIWSTRERP